MKSYNKTNGRSMSAPKQARCRAITIIILVAAFTWAFVVITWAYSLMIKPSAPVADKQMMDVKVQRRTSIDLSPDDTQHPAFMETIKSCDPNKNAKCMTFVPEGAQGDRIAVLYPPGALGYLFETFILEVVQLHAPKNLNATQIELIQSSHVPPYGYGKTHGLTKIIRLLVAPLQLAAADLVLGRINKGEVNLEDVRYTDIQQSMRQIVRWHCRLSHVAAHTSLMTITLEQLMSDPWGQEYFVAQFLNFQPKEFLIQQHLMMEQHIDEDALEESLEQILLYENDLLLRIEEAEKLPDQIEHLLDEVVNQELELTHSLKDWPCLSFWNAGDQSNPTEMNVIAKLNAQDFAPNCDGEFSSCFVARDKCEAKGDAICRDK